MKKQKVLVLEEYLPASNEIMTYFCCQFDSDFLQVLLTQHHTDTDFLFCFLLTFSSSRIMINVSPSVIRIISLPEHTKDIHCKLLQVQHKLQICLYINPQIRKVLTQISLVYVKRKEKKRKIYRKYNSWQ